MPRQRTTQPLRILVVEDHADLCYSLKLYLGMLGHTVHLAGSRADAVKALEAEEYDLLVLDLVLPEDAGGAVFDVPPSFRGKVITMSAYGSESAELRRLSPRLSALQHLQKPFASEELDFAIQQSCNQSPTDSR